MHYLSEFFTVASIDFLAILSPGVAWVLTIRNSFQYTRKIVIYSSIGLGLGIVIDVAIVLAGASFLTSKSGVYFSIIKYFGVGYLCFLGYKSITDKTHLQTDNMIVARKNITFPAAIQMGFITNATNVNAYLFFLSLFTIVVNRMTPFPIKVIYGAEMAVAEFVCFAILGTIISHRFVKQKLENFQRTIEKILGIILIILAIKIAFS